MLAACRLPPTRPNPRNKKLTPSSSQKLRGKRLSTRSTFSSGLSRLLRLSRLPRGEAAAAAAGERGLPAPAPLAPGGERGEALPCGEPAGSCAVGGAKPAGPSTMWEGGMGGTTAPRAGLLGPEPPPAPVLMVCRRPWAGACPAASRRSRLVEGGRPSRPSLTSWGVPNMAALPSALEGRNGRGSVLEGRCATETVCWGGQSAQSAFVAAAAVAAY